MSLSTATLKRLPKTEIVSINELKVDGENPNRMTSKQLARLKSSIEKYGFIVPIITNKDLVVADGEQRLTTAQQLQMKQVPVIRLNVEDVDRRLLRQVLNKLRGEHELVADALEFERIIEAGHEDELKLLLDINDSQLERYLAEIREPNQETYEIPEIDKIKTDIQRGDIYVLRNHRLMCGDATDKGDVQQLMNGQKADLLLTDPPYGINRVGKDGRISKDSVNTKGYVIKARVYAEFQGDKGFNLKPCLHTEFFDKMIIFGGNYFTDVLPPTNSWIIWDKRPEGVETTYFSDFEMAWANFGKPRIKKHTWSGAIREGKKENLIHPCQRPVELYVWCLSLAENISSVADLFGGSGSTLIACEQTGRICYMMEIDPRYCQVIVNRWESYTQQKAIKDD